MNFSPDELQNLARAHEREQRAIAITQKYMHKFPRPKAAPPIPMAPLAEATIAKTLASIDSHAARLFIVLSECEKDDFGIIRVERKELAEKMGLGLTSIALATATLRRNGLIQRIGRVGYLLRGK